MSRDDQLLRDKKYLGIGHPQADRNGYEKWPRYSVEIPPEVAEEIDRVHRRNLGVNASAASRAGVTRAGLRLYLETYAPEPEPAVEGTAHEIIERPLIAAGKETA